VPTPAALLAPGDQSAVATLSTFSCGTGGAWCPTGHTHLLVLARQAIGGPMPTAAALWSEDACAQAVAVFRAMARRAARYATAGSCLFTVADILRARYLTLSPAWRAAVLEHLLTALPGDAYDPPIPRHLDDAYDPPIPRHLDAALPRLLWVAAALRDGGTSPCRTRTPRPTCSPRTAWALAPKR
jgi:hypothetical protein